MDLILALEHKFAKINNQLDSNSRVELINNNYSNDFEAIHGFFDSSKEKKYKNGLNQCRDEMLKQMIQKRNEQLEQVNEFVQNMGENDQNNLKKLRILADSIELSYISFARSIISVFESILSRTKLGNEFNLRQLVKYLPLLKNEEQISMANIEHLIHNFSFSLDILPSNKTLFWSNFRDAFSIVKTNMMVLNKNGDLIKLRVLSGDFVVKVNATNIIAYKNKLLELEIYNFNLEPVYSFALDQIYHGPFRIYKNEIKLNNYVAACYDDKALTIGCYNFRTNRIKKENMRLDKSQLVAISQRQQPNLNAASEDLFFSIFLDLNEDFIFIETGFIDAGFEKNDFHYLTLFVLNRNDNNNVMKYFTNYLTNGIYIFFNRHVGLFCYEDVTSLKIYETNNDINMAFDQLEIDEIRFELNRMHPTSNRKHIYIIIRDIEYFLRSRMVTFNAY